MILRRWLLLVLLALLCSASALPVVGPPAPILGRVVAAANTFSEAEILGQFGTMTAKGAAGGAISRALPMAGRFIGYGGGVVIAGTLMYEALNWFYNEVKRETGTGLDGWYKGTSSSGLRPFPTDFPAAYEIVPGSATFLCDSNGSSYYSYNNGSAMIGGVYGRTYRDMDNFAVAPCGGSNNPVSSVPGAPAAMRNVLHDYLNAHPDVARTLLSPAPNDNQWNDSPYTNPTLDTDGDGVPDAAEYESPDGDPNDPAKKPQGVPYELGRQTTTTRNPDGSITTSTKITYSDGTTATDSTTTKTTTTRNPDGSTKSDTTTTKTTTDKDGATTTKTTTNGHTSPGNAPAPLPNGTPGPYRGPNPNGDDDTDGIPNQSDRSPYGPGGVPGSPVPSSPVDDSNSPKPSDPDYIPDRPDPATDPTKDPDRDAKKCAWEGGLFQTGKCLPDPSKLDKDKDPAACGLAGGVITDGKCAPDPKKDLDKNPEKCGLAGGVITDGKCAPDPKKDIDKDADKCGLSGGVITDGKCKVDPEKDKKECEKTQGNAYNSDTKKCGKEEDRKQYECGDFSISRLIKETGKYLKDVVFPCPADDMGWDEVTGKLAEKFPFSIISSMNNIVNIGDTGGGSQESSLPTTMGPFTLDFSFASTFFAFIRVAFRALIWFLFMTWLLNRVSGQVTLS